MKRFRRVLSFLVLSVFAFSSFASEVSAQFASPYFGRRAVAPSTNSPRTVDDDWSSRLFNETQIDFRGVPRGTTPRRSFEFVNRSDREIRLVSARSSCGCTKVYVPTKKTFKPGERGEIVAEIDAIRYTGARRAVVTAVFAAGASTAEIALQIRGNVVENVKIEPQTLKFIVDESESGDANQTTAQKLRNERNFRNSENAANAVRVRRTVFASPTETLVKAESANPFLRLEIGEPVATSGGIRTPLTVSLADDAPAGYFRDVVYLYANGPNAGTPFPVAVEGVVRPKFSVAPPTLSFAAGEKDEKIVKNVVVAGSKPFTIKKVECDSPAVEIDVRSTRAVRAENAELAENAAPARPVYVLPVAFDPTRLDAETSSAVLKIETNDGQILTLEAVLSAAHFARPTDSNADNSSLEKSEISEKTPQTPQTPRTRAVKTAVAKPVLRGTTR